MGKADLEINKKAVQEGSAALAKTAEEYHKRYSQDPNLDQEQIDEPLKRLVAFTEAIRRLEKRMQELIIPEQEDSDEYFTAKANVKQGVQFLKQYRNEIDRLVIPMQKILAERLILVDSPARYAQKVLANFTELTVEDIFLQDKDLVELLNKMKMQKEAFVRFVDLMGSKKMEHQGKSAFTNSIQLFDEDYKKLKQQAQERYEQLEGALTLERKWIAEKNAAVVTAKEVLQKVKGKLQSSNHPELPENRKLKEIFEQASKEVERVEKKNYSDSKSAKSPFLERTQRIQRECQEDVQLLRSGNGSINEKLAKALQAETLALKETREKIATQTERFMYFYGVLIRNLDRHELRVDVVQSLKEQFDSAYKETDEDKEKTDPLSFYQKKLERIVALTSDMQQKTEKQEIKICERIRKDIAITKQQFNKALLSIQEDINGAYLSGDDVKLARTLLETRPYTDETVGGSSDDLDESYRIIVNRKNELDHSILLMQAKLALYKQALEIVKAGSSMVLIKQLNLVSQSNVPDAAKLLGIIEKLETALPETREGKIDFLSKINKNLHLFSQDGLLAISTFIQKKNGKTAEIIKDKLAFIAENKGIDPKRFFQNEAVQLLLELGLKLRDFDADKILTNVFLHDALLALKEAEIKLTSKTAQQLINSPKKCAVIKNQHANKEDLYTVGQHAHFYDLMPRVIEDFLFADEETTQAIYNLQQADTDFCKPWFLVAVRHSKPLKEILLTEDKECRESSVRILRTLFTRQNAVQIISLDSFYDPKYVSIRDNLLGRINQVVQNENTILAALNHANKNPQRCNLHKAAQAIGFINDYIEIYPSIRQNRSADEKAALNKFRQDAIPILLGEQTIAEKQKAVTELAKEQFKPHPSYILVDILQCISCAFLLIMPIRYAMGKHAFFSLQKTEPQVAIEKSLEAAYKTSADGGPDLEHEGTNFDPTNL